MSLDPGMIVNAALAQRAELISAEDTDAWRVIHGQGDGVPGLVVERLGEALVAQLHEGHLRLNEGQAFTLLQRLQNRLGTQAVYKKIFPRDRDRVPADVAALHLDAQPWWGQPMPVEIVVREHGLRFLVRPYGGFATGAYLEHRPARQQVRRLAAGLRVLNLFCYTGGFSVAAAVGGATHVSSVDLSKASLEWCKRNFAANGLDPAAHRFFCSDVFDFYRRAGRQGRRYDLVILDPPTFSRVGRSGRTFVLERNLEELLAGAVGLVDAGGLVLLSVHQRDLTLTRMEGAVREAAGGRRCAVMDGPALGVDFPADPDYAKSLLARLDP